MASLSELLTNFKTLMHQYFPYTTDVNTSLNGKVDKETGKGLSTNDYTTTEKNKLAGLSNYSHPTAKQCSYSYSHPTSKQCNATIPTVDSSLSTTSTNAIQNKVIYNKVLTAQVTKLTVDNYNVTIDGTCVITCTLTDIFGTAKANTNVTVTCDKGYFTKYNNTSISGTTTKSKTGTTNSSGQFTLTYKASEWGLVTFSANNTYTQIRVTGWKTYMSDSNYTVRYNDVFVEVRATVSSFGVPVDWTEYAEIIPTDLRPSTWLTFLDANGNVQLRLSPSSNKIAFRSALGYGFTNSIYATAVYPRR